MQQDPKATDLKSWEHFAKQAAFLKHTEGMASENSTHLEILRAIEQDWLDINNTSLVHQLDSAIAMYMEDERSHSE